MAVLKFRLTRLRQALLHGIDEAEGRTGIWPFRRTVQFRVGLNCDAIHIEGDRLVVWQDSRLIAVARYAPGQAGGSAATDVGWERLLQPRDKDKH
jgi:hypothetical protein